MNINFFGEKLKAVRKSKHLTQLDLSRRLGGVKVQYQRMSKT